jgi:LmbE family N-acetylglucosaminyl deacetylase/glycosyltransferase involved in cell wall biosynthesis
MLNEAEAIPYDSTPLRGERLLVLAPHPDDEVIGCGGLIAQHLRENRVVRVVVATDGTRATGAAGDQEAYRTLREDESRRGLSVLGGGEIEFLRFPDRDLNDAVAEKIAATLRSSRPDLICVPSPIEIHPDHANLSRAFCELIQRDESLFADLATARVAFYEVSQPIRPNTLVDITDVAEAKYAAIAAHESQIALKDYVAYARGLNAYRAMTLPSTVKLAEGYWVTPLPAIRTTPFVELRKLVGHAPIAEVVRERLPIAVVMRTRDRPALLHQAIESVEATGYGAEIVVVNDGGAKPELGANVRLVEHRQPRGRSEAMNSGVRAAKSKYVAFLDDDDLYYPEHLGTLSNAASATPNNVAWYTDALSAFVALGPSGSYETRKRLRLFGQDFDRELLLIDNYIPLPTLLVARETFVDAGGFDPAFDLFEDWDFLIRLSQRGDFAHVPRLTCEIRHVEGGGSITLEAPEGSARFREAKLQLWQKHRDSITHDVFANVYERHKRRSQEMESALAEEKGRRNHADTDVARLEREKNLLIAELQALHHSINEKLLDIKQLEGAMGALKATADQATQTARENAEIRRAFDDSQAAGQAAYVEVERLQGLLDMIYRSRTWKLHAMVEKMRGRH